MAKVIPSASSASAWSGKSIIDNTTTPRKGSVVLNNNLGASHSLAGLDMTCRKGDIVDLINRGASPFSLAANDTAADARTRFNTAMTLPANGRLRLYYNGSTWEPYSEGGLPQSSTVASAATIVPTARFMTITGTTGITAITGTNVTPGQIIHLLFQGAVTVTNAAGSLMLAGAANFSATADDILGLAWDGTKWREVSRSVN